jgi:hypothetical protein
MRSNRWILAAVIVGAACGGEKPETQAESKAAAPAPVVTAATDSANKVVTDTTKPAKTAKAESTTTKKANAPLRDSAFGPVSMVDSTGKVTPIKKRP